MKCHFNPSVRDLDLCMVIFGKDGNLRFGRTSNEKSNCCVNSIYCFVLRLNMSRTGIVGTSVVDGGIVVGVGTSVGDGVVVVCKMPVAKEDSRSSPDSLLSSSTSSDGRNID